MNTDKKRTGDAPRTPSRRGKTGEPDSAYQPPVTGRLDASKDLPVDWKWKGFGQTPVPEFTFSSVLIDGRRVAVSWSETGWAGSRAAFLCPVCGKRSRFLYTLQDGSVGCNQHVSKSRVKLERILSKLRKAKRMQRNHKYRAAGRRLERDAEDELWSLWDFDGAAAWARREIERAKRSPGGDGAEADL